MNTENKYSLECGLRKQVEILKMASQESSAAYALSSELLSNPCHLKGLISELEKVIDDQRNSLQDCWLKIKAAESRAKESTEKLEGMVKDFAGLANKLYDAKNGSWTPQISDKIVDILAKYHGTGKDK